MKALVVGGGSIGARHLRNLKTLGLDALGVADPDPERCTAVAEEVGAGTFGSLGEGLAQMQPDIVALASPTHLHLEQALEAARAGCHLFVEKPLSHCPEGMAALVDAVAERDLVTLVGCNMRFHPGPARVRALLDDGAIGRLLSARVHTGSYLPGWRPHQDYRRSYSANAEMGGGCLLDCIHEVDLACWYAGDVERVYALLRNQSALELDVEDLAVLVCEHEAGAVSEVHLDYFHRHYERGCRLAGETGSILWDFDAKQVRWYEAPADCWHTFDEPEGWAVNQMYLDEMVHFLDAVRTRRPTTLPVAGAARLMETVFAARVSSEAGRRVDVRAAYYALLSSESPA